MPGHPVRRTRSRSRSRSRSREDGPVDVENRRSAATLTDDAATGVATIERSPAGDGKAFP